MALLKPWIGFTKLDIVFTLIDANVKFKKYFLFQRIVCVVAQSTRHISSLCVV